MALAFFAGGHIPVLSKIATPFASVLVVLVYFAVLVVTGELGKEDLSLVVSIAMRRAKR